MKKYGHLRPSTYSISVKNYTENYKKYFSNNIKNLKFKKSSKFTISKKNIKLIDNNLKKHKLFFNFNDLIKFSKKSIEGREYAKLIFSKSIEEIFKNLKKLAKEVNIDFKEFEHLDISLVLKSFSS